MSRHPQSKNSDMSFVILFLVGAAAWTHWAQLVHITFIALSMLGCLLILRLSWKFVTSHRFASLNDVDNMGGVEFEHYIAWLLIKTHYKNVSLTEKYDLGVDIIAEKDGVRWGIQVKRYSGLVKAEAVRQVVTGLRFYGCDHAMVITNSSYGTVARQLAASNNCILVDRAGLNRLRRRSQKLEGDDIL